MLAAKALGKPFPNRLNYIFAALVADENLPLALATLETMTDDPQRSLRMASMHRQWPEQWLFHMNEHLAKTKLAPIALTRKEGATLFQRLTSHGTAMMNDGPLVSVVMSCHNSESWVAQAVRSILDQTWRNLELLAYDDCSTDRTHEILLKLAETDPRLKVFRSEMNCGTYVSRNKGLRIARGTYFTTQDSDDWAHPQRIEWQVREMLANPTLVACKTIGLRMQENGRLQVFRTGNVVENFVPASFMFHRERVMEAAGYWDCVRAGADVEYILRLKALGIDGLIRTLGQTLVFMLDREGSLTTTAGLESRDGHSSAARIAYGKHYREHHKTAKNLRMEFSSERAFDAPIEMLVPKSAIDAAIMQIGPEDGAPAS